MPLWRYPAYVATTNRKTNDCADWGDRGKPNRVEPVTTPAFDVPFKLVPGESIFTIGSCFARNVESELMRLGFDLPLRNLFREPEFENLDIGIINNYGTPSIYNDFAWALGEIEYPFDDNIVELPPSGKFVDLHLSPTMRPESRETVVRRRNAALQATRTVRTCRVVIMTLGLVEVWFDLKTGTYLNVQPRLQLLRHEPDRFELHVMSFEETYRYLDQAIGLLKKHGRPDLQVVITVSPVPLAATNRKCDVIVANCYSKSVLRAVAESICAAYSCATYYPSYESIVTSDRRLAFGDDLRHVTKEMVSLNVGRMVNAFVDADFDLERVGAEIAAGGLPVALEKAKLAAAMEPVTAAAFFDAFAAWSEASLPFAMIHAAFLKPRDPERALSVLRRHEADHGDDVARAALTAECLVACGRSDEALAIVESLSDYRGRTASLWTSLLETAIGVADNDLVLRIVALHAAHAPTQIARAYLSAAEYFENQNQLAKALALYRSAMDKKHSITTALKVSEILFHMGQHEEAKSLLISVKPVSEKDKRSFDKLWAVLS